MACHGARRLLQMTDNLFSIIGIEALTAARSVEFRAPLATSPELSSAIAAIRSSGGDAGSRPLHLAGDLQATSDLVASGG